MRILIVFWLIICSSPAFCTNITLSRYIEIEQKSTDNDEYKVAVTWYIAGTLDALTAANSILLAKKQEPLFCAPKGLELTPDNIRQLINDLIHKDEPVYKEHWETYSELMSLSGMAFRALNETFSCK